MTGPPRLSALLLWLSGRRDRSGIEADLAELFARRAAQHGVPYARRRHWRDVLSFVIHAHRRPSLASRLDFTIRSRMFMSAFAFDVRQAFRAMRRQPAFFVVASLTLAIGFSAHLSAFALLDRLLLARPAHVADPDDVVRVHIDRERRGTRYRMWQTPYRSYLDLRASHPGFRALAAYRASTGSVGTGAEAREVAIVYADEQYFPLLGARAQLGRTFGGESDAADGSVVVLSDAFWRGALAADPAVLGKPLTIGPAVFTIIGVMPQGFSGDMAERVDVWVPLEAASRELPVTWKTSLTFQSVLVLGRLAPETSRAVAADQIAAAYRRGVEGTAVADPTAYAVLAPLNPGRTQTGELSASGRIAVWIQGVALLVLLVAIANVVNLQLTRAAQQRREQAVRAALGAGWTRIASKLTLEIGSVCGVAALGAYVLTHWTATGLQQLVLPDMEGLFDPVTAGLVTLGAFGLTLVACLGLTLLHMRGDSPNVWLKSGRGGDGFSRERLRQALLVGQLVMSALLLTGAGLFVRSMQELGRLEFGHDQDRVLVVTLPLAAAGYTPEAIEALFDRAVRELPSLPGVESAAAAQSTPFAPSQSAELHVPGMERLPIEPRQHPTFYTVTPAFFSTMGMKILRGRGFTEGDRAGSAPVLVVEDALARVLFPDADPLGKCLIVGSPASDCRTIVGVVSNTRRFVQRADGALRYYVPMAQRVIGMTPQALFLRTSRDPVEAIPQVRDALLAIDGRLPYARMRPLAQLAEPEMRPWRLGSTLFVLFGVAALVLATTGVYALLTFMVTQRSREIGVRLALGASPAGTCRLVLRQSLGWVALGLAIGLGLAVVGGRFVRPILFQTSPYDASVLTGTAAILVVVAGAASLIPAIRASRVDPAIALRAE